jgi:hypothetical protein
MAERTEMDEEVEKRIRGEIEEGGVLMTGKISVSEGEFGSIGASSTLRALED